VNEKWSVILLFGWFLLVACSQSKPSPTTLNQGSQSTSPAATVEPKPSQDLFLRPTVVTRIVTETPLTERDSPEPWCLDTAAAPDQASPWETVSGQLAAAELADYLTQAGVIELCLPPELGAPILDIDWNAAVDPPTAKAGRWIQIGFDGIDGLYFIFATYDLAVDSEHTTYASRADYEALQAGVRENAIVVNGTPGFLFVGDAYGFLEKAYVFPFAKHYVAIVYRLKDEENPEDQEALKAAITHPPYPTERTQELHTLDEMMASIRLREITPPSISAEAAGTG
jgi:hypothetical protein